MDAGPLDPLDARTAGSGADAAPTAGNGCELPFELEPLAPRDCSLEVCRGPSRYEVRVRSSRPWYDNIAAQYWTMVACRTGFLLNELLDASGTGYTYPLTEAEFEALPDTAPVRMFYGNNPFDSRSPLPVYRGPAAECGFIDKTQVPDCSSP